MTKRDQINQELDRIVNEIGRLSPRIDPLADQLSIEVQEILEITCLTKPQST